MKNCITCGAQIEVDAMVCPVCGATQAIQTGNIDKNEQIIETQNNYSHYQEPQSQPQPQVIIHQTYSQPYQNNTNQANLKSKGTAALLAILLPFFGLCGIHRFYTGHIGIGIIQLLTGGGCLIWQIIDIILIASGSLKDADGRPLKV